MGSQHRREGLSLGHQLWKVAATNLSSEDGCQETMWTNLKFGKSIGVDFRSNEMLKHGVCEELIKILADIYNAILNYCYTLLDFNTSLGTPIP